MRWLLLLLPVLAFADTTEDVIFDLKARDGGVGWKNGVGYFSYLQGSFDFTGAIPKYNPVNVLTLNWSLDVRMDCANSIGGFCNDPNGIPDTLSASISVGNGEQYAETRTVLELEEYFNEWRTYDGTEVYTNTSQAYDSVKFRIEGKDQGFWAGFYGPKIRSPEVSVVSSPVELQPAGPDCSDPLNDVSCSGYWDAVAASTVTNEYTDVIFGDEIEDFYTVSDIDDPHEDTGFFDDPVFEDDFLDEDFFEEDLNSYLDVTYSDDTLEDFYAEEPYIKEIDEVYEVIEQRTEEPVNEPVNEPVQQDSKELAVEIVLAQIETITTQAIQQSVSQTVYDEQLYIPEVTQQVQQTTDEPMQEIESAKSSSPEIKFEQDFNTAIASGQSINQFLSQQQPNFSRFDVKPPSAEEQNTTQKASQALQTMSQQQISESIEEQLKEVQDAGGFADQSLTVLLISNKPEFNQYNQVQLTDKPFYRNKVIYAGNRTADRPLLLRSGSNTYNAMVDAQWQR